MKSIRGAFSRVVAVSISIGLALLTAQARAQAAPAAAAAVPKAGARAPASDKPDVPAPLLPWVPWVLADAPDHACAFAAGAAQCVFPGQIVLELDDRGGHFSQRVVIDRALRVALPGSSARWPQAVSVNKKPAAVLDDGGVPSVMLAAGAHRIDGRFTWKALPDRLELPALTAAVALKVRGEVVSFPKRDERGQLWLQGGPSGGEPSEQLGLSVSRKLEDGVPLIVTTRIKLRISGRAREVSLGDVLLAGTTPLSLTSELPARLEQNGELRLQVRAGTYTVELSARSATPPSEFAYKSASALWPESEIWVWQADEALRQVELSGAPAVEASRTDLDLEWRALPAFALHAGSSLKLKTTRRGEAAPPPNRLNLTRELWLDLDGRGYTVRDRIDAELRQGFRLDLLAGELGHVAADGEDQLVTKSNDKKHAGVELRKQKQAIVAEWRLPNAAAVLPAVGWSEDVQSLAMTLHLGPGFRLLAARGVDSVSESWLEGWDLFDFFFVLLVALAVGRLAGRKYALLALVTLVLCHGEDDAPVAIWFALLTLIALLKVLPAGFFRNLVRLAYAACVLSLLLIVVPFVVTQIRVAIYPQLGLPEVSFGAVSNGYGEESAGAAVPEAQPASPAPMPMKAAVQQLKRGLGSGGAYDSSAQPEGLKDGEDAQQQQQQASRALQQDPEATVQTGPGVPTWRFRNWNLRWSGPVDRAHELRLYLLSPGQNRALAFLRVLLLAWLIAVLLRAAHAGKDRPARKPEAKPPAPSAPQAAVVVQLFCVLSALLAPAFVPALARADIPDQATLDALRQRLLKPAGCRPSCASIDTMRIDLRDAGLTLTLSVHAGERTSVSLPGPAATFVPTKVTLDKKAEAPMVLLADGFLHVRLEPGVHTVELFFPLPESDSLALSFADRPHRAEVQAAGWKVDGVREDGSVEGALQLSRLLSASERALQGAALPPFLVLERTLELGPSWEVRSQLRRISPPGTPIVVRVPLLAGESVTESTFETTNGELQVAFGRDDEVVEWGSRLAQSDRIELLAPKDRPWSERWKLLCGPIWRCEIQGLTPVSWLEDEHVQPELAPWPGEHASVRVTRPEAAKGQSITIDHATLDVTPGVRIQKASLELGLRSSRGSTETLSLPAHARVQRLAVDGRERPVHEQNGKLMFGLEPGQHNVELQWQEARGLTTVLRAPELRLGRPAANASVVLHVPNDRWLLWVSGPAFGPAILFWGYLLFVILAALALARVPHTPLRGRQWLLLGLGLTQVPAPAAIAIVAWFFALAYRARMPEQRRLVHNLTQIALAWLTLSALGCLYFAVQNGLLVQPDMQVMGTDNPSTLRFYVDQSTGALPTPSLVSVPRFWWQLLMLAWSLWLAASLVRWLPWAFQCYGQGGLWKKGVKKTRTPSPLPPPPAAGPLSSIPPAAPPTKA